MTLVFLIAAVLAAIHGAVIAFMPPRSKWTDRVESYRTCTLLSFGFFLICFITVLFILITPAANPLGIPVGQDLVKFANDNRGPIGQIVIAFVVTLLIVFVELFFVDKFKETNSPPDRHLDDLVLDLLLFQHMVVRRWQGSVRGIP